MLIINFITIIYFIKYMHSQGEITMKIFLTGATGKVGSRFATYLINQGISVKALVRDFDRAKFLADQGVELVLGDLSNKETLVSSIAGTDAVIHLAAQFRGDISEEAAWESNVYGTKNLAEAALDAGVKKFIFSSTSLVYMDITRTTPCIENDILEPKGLYPRTKVAAENVLQELKRDKGLDSRILRFAFVYGDGDAHLSEFAPIMSNWNTEQAMSMIHHADICRALYLALITENVNTGVYNVADQQPSTVKELLTATNTPSKFNENSPELNAYGMILSTDAIEKELGFIAKYSSFNQAKKAGAL